MMTEEEKKDAVLPASSAPPNEDRDAYLAQYRASYGDGGNVFEEQSRRLARERAALTPTDPEQAKRAKFAAALTDGLSSLVEMFAHGQGAYVRNREGETSSQTTNARLRELQEKYERELRRVNDEQYRLDAAKSARDDGITGAGLAAYRQQKRDAEDKRRYDEGVARAESHRTEDLARDEKRYKESVALQKSRLAASGGGRGGVAERGHTFFVPYIEGDGSKDGVLQTVNGKGRYVTLSNADVDHWATKARQDRGFMKAYKDLVEKKPATRKVLGDGSLDSTAAEYIDKKDLATLYFNYVYEMEIRRRNTINLGSGEGYPNGMYRIPKDGSAPESLPNSGGLFDPL
jgi:hypothetical protein